MADTNCSVTIMPIMGKRIGFLRRDLDNSYADLLIAPGGTIETQDGELIDGVLYHSVELGAIREMWEKTGIKISKDKLNYFCSLTTSNDRVVISLFCEVNSTQIARSYGYLEFLTKDEIMSRDDFAPGMKEEALILLQHLQRKGLLT